MATCKTTDIFPEGGSWLRTSLGGNLIHVSTTENLYLTKEISQERELRRWVLGKADERTAGKKRQAGHTSPVPA